MYRGCLVLACGLTVMAASACGAKGPPLPPLRPVPAAPTGLSISRVGDRVTVRVQVPDAAADPETRLSISAVEVYARTLPMGSEAPTAEQLVRKDYLVGTIQVRPPAPLDAAGEPVVPDPATPADARPGPGEMAVWSETLAAAPLRPLELTRQQKARVDAQRPILLPLRPTGLAAPWFRLPLPTRYYAAVGISERRRAGAPSQIVAVPFGPSPEVPGAPRLTFTETELTLTWTTRVERAPVIVVETTRTGAEKPVSVREPPITTGAWSTPVVFGAERCFVVRGVVRRGPVSTESASVGPVCETPKDIFGPAAPIGLVPVSSPEAVTLVWDAVTAPDLAGYLILRLTGGAETVEELTPKPIAALQFADSTARPGQRYVYYVVAVDAAGNRGPRSAGVTVDRFTPTGR